MQSNNYIAYHTEGSHQSTYSGQTQYNNTNQTSHAAHSHYNSSNSGQTYGHSVNHFSDMFSCSSGRNVYAANISPAIRQQIPSSNVKYWNSEQQMSQNSHNYNQGIPPPPLVSRTQGISSPTIRSPQCNTSNSYSGVTGHHSSSSQSPQGWSRSPNVMHSPSTTPSPLQSHPSHNRSPSQQFSPPHTTHTTHSGLTDSSQHQKSQITVSYSNQNNTSSQLNSSNPLQSLQKMVMIDSDNSDIRSGYDNIQAATLQNNGTVTPLTPNLIQKTYNNDQSVNNDPESPYPTYYNLDQNRLCTPPRPSPVSAPVLSYPNIPDAQTDGFALSEAQLCESENELKKDETTDKKDNKAPHDLIYPFECNSNIVESKTEPVSEINAKMLRETEESVNSVNPVNGGNVREEINKMDDSSAAKLSHEAIQEQSRVPAMCKRTSSQDSLQSSDSETAHLGYADSRAPHNLQMNQMENFANQSDNKNMWWSQNSLPQTSQSVAIPQTTSSLTPINSGVSGPYLAYGRPNPPSLTPAPSSYTSHMQCGPESWAPSASSSHSSTPPLNTSNKHFASPKSLRDNSPKKKRGRPFGSKNRRNSEDTGSETNVSDTPSPVKKRKKSIHTEEIGINTTVSIDAHGFDELAVVNPIKQVSGSSKRKKVTGPFIRMEKLRGRKATVYSIVNASTKQEDEKDVKSKTHAITESTKHMRRPSLIGASKKVVSTLSPHYDLNTRDKTWICALCHKGPHFKGLGDLYGPYYITAEEKIKANPSCATTATNITTPSSSSSNTAYNSIDETINAVVANELPSNEKRLKNSSERRRKSDTSDDGNTKRQKQISKTATPVSTSQSPEVESSHPHSQNNTPTEVWIHEDCIVWSSGAYLVGHRVRNLEEIVIESNENVSYFLISC